MTSDHRRVRLLLGAAAHAASLTIPLAACSSTTAGKGATTTAPTGTGVGNTDAGGTTGGAPADPAGALHQALAALANGYHFSATVKVNNAVQLSADGDRVGAKSRLAITRTGATVQYIITADGSWAKPTGGDWQVLDVAPATSDPIDSLRTPVSVTVQSVSGSSVQLKVVVVAKQLGIDVAGNVPVIVTLTGGAITLISYDATVQGGTANVSTVIGKVADATPITAPNV